jgi:hypothetical protein
MSDATGAPTQNYNFKRIAGVDIAGYTSINAVITSIDENLNNHFNGMILLMQSSSTVPAGWEDYTVGNGYPNALPAPDANHKYIIKI